MVSKELDDDMLVVIIGGSDSEDQDLPFKTDGKDIIATKEDFDEHDLIQMIETAKRHGEELEVLYEGTKIKEEYNDDENIKEEYNYDENIKEEYNYDENIKEEVEDEQYNITYSDSEYINESEYVDGDYLEQGVDDYNDEDYIPEEEKSSSDSETDEQPKRWTLLAPNQQKSFIADLRQEYPELRNDNKALISTVTEIMRNIKRPPPPRDYFIMNDILFECRKCGTMSDRIQSAARHYQEKHGPRYLVCFACGVDFRSTTNLYKHEKRCVAPDAIIMLKARAQFLGRKGRGRPFLPNPNDVVVHQPIAKRFPCTMCSAIFNNKINLEAHINLHKGLRPYRCKHCGRAYTSYPRLQRHMKIHSNDQFVCDHCGRLFKVKPALVAHMNTHLPVPKFGCDHCDRRFATKDALKHHVRRVHLKLPSAFSCPICPKNYPRMSLVKDHVSKKHGLALMTRNMFFKQLPKLSDSQLQQAQEILLFEDSGENPVILET